MKTFRLIKNALISGGILAGFLGFAASVRVLIDASNTLSYHSGAMDYTPRRVITKKLNSDSVPDLVIYDIRGKAHPMIANTGESSGTYVSLEDYEKKQREQIGKDLEKIEQDSVSAEHQFLQTKRQIESELECELQNIRREAGDGR